MYRIGKYNYSSGINILVARDISEKYSNKKIILLQKPTSERFVQWVGLMPRDRISAIITTSFFQRLVTPKCQYAVYT